MDAIHALQYFNSPDGPHISVEKLAIYCGINENTMRDYIKERYNLPRNLRIFCNSKIYHIILRRGISRRLRS